MIHIEQIKIVSNTYPGNILDEGFKIECDSVNLLVGNQGCGKSTLLKMLQQQHTDLKLKLTDYVINTGVDSFFFDSEHDNPRTKDPMLYTTPSGQSKGYGLGNGIRSRFRSHGEVLEELIIDPLLKAKNSVILLDEPESGLSITNQFKLIEAIKTAVNNKNQLFIATHCYPLIKQFNVISLEHKQQMTGTDFISKVSNI